jgi:hypothetical protein
MSPKEFGQDSAAEEQIRSIVAAQASAWDAGDAKAFAKDLAPDASFTNRFGTVMYGPALFAERHRMGSIGLNSWRYSCVEVTGSGSRRTTMCLAWE